uniref:Endoglucanase n=1 Tax=Radopholus similis TaxID=46012 RepID=B9U290_RADSI|nr:beta-1,4-endoglucanase-1 precursor [Radopholus similis]
MCCASALLGLLCLATFFASATALTATAPPYGQLSVSGTKLLSSSGTAVALHGNSLFWSQWYPDFWTASVVQQLKCNWNANIVRAAMGVDQGGYLTTASTQYALVVAVVEAAITQGIYVIVDWHVSATYQSDAVAFFTKVSAAYGSYPHVLYETYNEPTSVSWTDVLVPYHKAVIAAIRANDADNIIICGTPTWSQDVEVASANPITGYSNIMYTFHYYAATHGASYRSKVTTAVNNGLPVFVTEYGTCESSGSGTIDSSSSATWWTFLDGLGISYVNWAIDNKDETCAALTTSGSASTVGSSSYWSTSGKLVNAQQVAKSNGVSCSSSATTTTTTTKSGATTTTTKASATTTTTKASATTTTTKASSSSSSSVTASVSTTNSWSGGSQVAITFKNSGSSSVCTIKFTITLPSGTTISSIWNASVVSGTTYTTASYFSLAAGSSDSSIGMVLTGSGTPTVSIVSTSGC